MADRRRNLGIPSGVVFPFAGTLAPYGYLICDGRPVLKSEYPNLFLSIGFSHGDGSQNSDGTASGFTSTTHFNLPDYRGRFLRGVDGDAGRDPDKASRTGMASGGNTGDTVGSVQLDAMQLITGNISSTTWRNGDMGTYSGAFFRSGTGTSTGAAGPNSTPAFGFDSSRSPDARTSTESRPKNVNVNYIIKI
jgi:microcystin-dependent protein